MSGEHACANYELAKAEADKVDAQIIETLKSGCSFRVEAGAGSGKTYSLNRVIEWIQANKWSDYSRKKQNVVCITYTNAAVDVIAERLAKDSFILPSTIHSFAWNAIKQYQSVLIDAFTTNPDFQSDEGDFDQVTEVAYTLGHRYKENGIQYLYHDDVLKLFCLLLDNAKDAPETMYASDATIQQFLNLDYAQFIAVRDFLYPDAQFSTEHGVKGEEYDNVVFVISKGWNQYQFETYAPMITGHTSIPKGKEASYERNRNLFYVCCSRPRKKLYFFVTVPVEQTFRTFLTDLVGKDNICTYQQFMQATQ